MGVSSPAAPGAIFARGARAGRCCRFGSAGGGVGLALGGRGGGALRLEARGALRARLRRRTVELALHSGESAADPGAAGVGVEAAVPLGGECGNHAQDRTARPLVARLLA